MFETTARVEHLRLTGIVLLYNGSACSMKSLAIGIEESSI